jgi:cytidylate kinase
MSRLSDDSATLSDHRIQEWFVQQRTLQEREAREQAQADALKTLVPDAQAPPPVITVTRQIGSSGDAVARAVAEKLSKNWQVWDNEIIEAIARSAGVQTRMVETLDEHVSSAIEDFIRDLFALREMEPLGYQHHLARVLLQVAQQGCKIFVGRAANFLLPNALHVRVQAGMETRIRTLMHEHNITRAEAARLIHHTDQERAAFVQNLAHHRINEEGAYDLTVWIDRLGVQAAADTIAAAARAMFPERC